MIDRKMRKNEKEGVMQRENERIIYHLMHFNEKDKEWSERPYLLLEDMAIVFDILDLDGRSIQRIDHKKANEEQWSDQFLWESAKKNTKQLLPAKFESVYKDFRGHTEDRPVFMVSNEIQRYGAGVICYEDIKVEEVYQLKNGRLYVHVKSKRRITGLSYPQTDIDTDTNIIRVCIYCQPVFMKCYCCLMTEQIRKRIYCTY